MRLFVSVNFPSETVDFLYDKVTKLKKEALSMNPSRRENLHLTLAFIGETQDSQKAEKALSEIDFEPFEIMISGLGKFSRDGGDIYWAGLDKKGDYRKLEALALEVQSKLRSAGFEIEKRKFSPHITLGREVILQRDPSFSVPSHKVPVSRISLMRSERVQGKLVYTEIFGKDAL